MKSIPLQKIEGLLLGAAVADAIGLPTEGMSPAKIEKLGWAKDLRHRLFFGRGMWSDDTEHSIMLSQALLTSNGDHKKFSRSLAWEFRMWLLGIPAASGMATAKAILKLWMGFPPKHSGVFSAGNGPAMRAAPVAAMFPDSAEQRRAFTEAQTKITHSDPKALIGAQAICEVAAALLTSATPPEIISILEEVSDDPQWREIVDRLDEALLGNLTLSQFIDLINGRPQKGVSGYIYQTVPAVLFLGIRNGWDYEKTITQLIAAGGDTDTTAAIAGALCGAFGGRSCIPNSWINEIKEWPTNMDKLSELATALVHGKPCRIRARWSPMLILRNVTFLLIVLGHGFSRPFRRPHRASRISQAT